MTNVVQFPNEREIADAAGEWIARLDRGLSQHELSGFQEWMAADHRHSEALFRLADVWDRMDLLKDMSALFSLHASNSSCANPGRRWALALSLSLIFVISLMVWLVTNEVRARNFEATYATQVGRQLSVELPDHSRIRLNTATVVKVRYSRGARSVEMLQGEAHFEVAKNEARLFKVLAGNSEFRAVGTAFDVRLEAAAGAALTVTEGRVQVLIGSLADGGRGEGSNFRTGRPATGRQSPSNTKVTTTEIMVDAGKMVAIGPATQTVTRLSAVQLQAALAWQDGMILFDGRPLEEAVSEVSRYSNVRFRIVQDDLRAIPVSGYFKAGDVDALISNLENNFDIQVKREGDVIVLSAPGS